MWVSFTCLLHSHRLENSFAHTRHENPVVVLTTESSPSGPEAKTSVMTGTVYCHLISSRVLRATIDVILYFAPVNALVAVGALVLAQAHVGLLNVSSTVGSLDKLLSTLVA